MVYFRPVKLILIFICAFILFELMLFFTGRFLLFARRNKHNSHGAISIVCVGDSHTFGVGTTTLYSYPKQLETLLNANNQEVKFSVVNLGIPGSSTKQQVEELKAYLKNNRVDYVFLLTGRNNQEEVRMFNNSTVLGKIIFSIRNLKSIKFIKTVLSYLWGIRQEDSSPKVYWGNLFKKYLAFYLEECRRLCFAKGAKLVLLSYYNSSDATIKEFANRYGLCYLDLVPDFEDLFKRQERTKYISSDMSHMNFKGYKFFAEAVYNKLFLNQMSLDLKLNPLLTRIADNKFYTNRHEMKQLIYLQEERIIKYKDSWQYPFEMIHMGHIYMESGNKEAAKDYYLKGLRISNYANNNTLVAPIINWYLTANEKSQAFAICEEILLNNPHNTITLYYRDWILKTAH